jgi:hypothetical protein
VLNIMKSEGHGTFERSDNIFKEKMNIFIRKCTLRMYKCSPMLIHEMDLNLANPKNPSMKEKISISTHSSTI